MGLHFKPSGHFFEFILFSPGDRIRRPGNVPAAVYVQEADNLYTAGRINLPPYWRFIPFLTNAHFLTISYTPSRLMGFAM